MGSFIIVVTCYIVTTTYHWATHNLLSSEKLVQPTFVLSHEHTLLLCLVTHSPVMMNVQYIIHDKDSAILVVPSTIIKSASLHYHQRKHPSIHSLAVPPPLRLWRRAVGEAAQWILAVGGEHIISLITGLICSHLQYVHIAGEPGQEEHADYTQKGSNPQARAQPVRQWC